jgi:oxalate decarboxylase/phosphoglucose isomerase-like protein (cupin superfamily)
LQIQALKLSFATPDTPPNNPAAIYTGQTVFTATAIQMKHVVIEPCGVIAAHIHPRGTEWGYVIAGHFEFGMFLEDRTHITVQYRPGEGVVIPQGTVHYARNTACDQAEIVVIFDHPDPAVVYVGQALSTMPEYYLKSAVNNGTAFQTAANRFLDADCKC